MLFIFVNYQFLPVFHVELIQFADSISIATVLKTVSQTRPSFADFNFYYALIQFVAMYYLPDYVVHEEHPQANTDNVNTLLMVSHLIYPNRTKFLRQSYGDCMYV